MKKQKKVLEYLVKKLKGINWALVGSTNLAIQGVDIKPHDIDILTDKEGIYAIEKILKRFEKEPVMFRETKQFKSNFGIFEIDDIKIEVMENLQNRIKNKWVRTNDLSKRKFIKFEGIELPVIPLEEEYRVYKKLGRIERANKIKKLINQRNSQ
jgi:predicted nucleotidyltransferase